MMLGRVPRAPASQSTQDQCFRTLVLPYRCGAVPESHRVPFSSPTREPENREQPQAMGANPSSQYKIWESEETLEP